MDYENLNKKKKENYKAGKKEMKKKSIAEIKILNRKIFKLA